MIELGDVIHLMGESHLHKDWFVHDVNRLIIPPLNLGQYVSEYEGEKLVGFATVAFMDMDSLSDFLNGVRKVQPSDFNNGDIPVLMDVIGPWGHGRVVALKMRKFLRGKGLSGKRIWSIRRYDDYCKVGASVI